ncbi:MAG TPA: hypothetical protein VGB73_00855 [Pyrinomonadaceae bacterium]|jgi:hypothetical protein
MQKISYLGLPNCYRLSNGQVEAVVTTDVGPRILRYGFVGGENALGEVPELSQTTTLGEWKPWGGHRLWAAPEAMPRSYAPDNSPLEYDLEGDRAAINLRQPVEAETGIEKELHVRLEEQTGSLLVRHKITNRNLWGIVAAPWALTIMHGGGLAILPQEPYRSHSDYLLPARPLVMWHYTDLSDPRWRIGKRYVCLRSDPERREPQKIGIANKQGWAAYHRAQMLFVKRFSYEDGATYPDYGCNNEVFTAGSFIEVESLAPLRHLEPGESVEHSERWYLFGEVELEADEESALEASISPLIEQTIAV